MHLLFVSNDVGLTAPGIVYRTLLNELSKYVQLSLVAPEICNICDIPRVKILPTISNGYNHYGIEKLSFELLGRNILDIIWVAKQKKVTDINKIARCDAIIACVSLHHYRSLMLCTYLAKKNHKPLIVYSVDAVPPPNGWGIESLYRKRLSSFYKKQLKYASAYYSSNKQMLSYQLSELDLHLRHTGYIYTPIGNSSITIGDADKNFSIPTFLYTGGLYGPRKIEMIIEGFRQLLYDIPNAKIVFVGTGARKLEPYQDLMDSGNVEIFEYQSDLLGFYKRATVLLDINAYFDNDVFLSSKIVNYLPIKLPIVSITGLNSPSRNVFTDDSSIIHCKHDPNDIYNAMKKALCIRVNEVERNKYVEMFSPAAVVRDLVSYLNSTI